MGMVLGHEVGGIRRLKFVGFFCVHFNVTGERESAVEDALSQQAGKTCSVCINVQY